MRLTPVGKLIEYAIFVLLIVAGIASCAIYDKRVFPSLHLVYVKHPYMAVRLPLSPTTTMDFNKYKYFLFI